MIEEEVKKMNLHFCALCHTAIDPKRFGVRDVENWFNNNNVNQWIENRFIG